jgi:uncharacterized repeat protein (TIGR02543 family)
MKKFYYYSLPILIVIVFFIYGCCSSGGGGGVGATFQGDSSEIQSRTVRIDSEGRLPTITFPSGATIEASEKNTLQPGIYVTVTEQKISSSNESFFKDFTGSNNDYYTYKIVAVLDSSSKKTDVTTVEKPFVVTLPNTQSETGLCYIGIRNSETDPWRFCRVEDGSTSVSSLRFATSAAAPKKCTFKLHRLGLSFALVVYNGNPTKNLPETAVDSLVVPSSYNVLAKNGKFLEDLEIKGVLKGVKVNSLNPSDFIARVTYRNNNSTASDIKVNGDYVEQTTKQDKTIPNYSYSHSFEVTTVSDSLLMNTEGEFVINLNLTNVETKSFASGFLIEFYNKIESEKILPYVYTEFSTLTNVGSIKVALNPVESDVANKSKNLFILNPRFTISSTYNFNDSDKKKIADAITVSKVDSDSVIKTWNGKELVLSFSKSLENDTTYKISMAEVSGLKVASLEPFADFSFTTVGKNCEYTVVHQKENLDGTYKVETTEKLTVLADSEVTPDVKSYSGFESPVKQTVKISHGAENKIVYSYPRKEFNLTVVAGTGIKEVSGSGSYKYGANVVASYTLQDGYVFRNWTGEKTVGEFTMPDKDVSMQANAIEGDPSDGSEHYIITYLLNGGEFEGSYRSSYGENTETFTLSTPRRDGCKFLGWVTPESQTPQMTITIAKGTKGDKIFSANWEYESYHLTLQKGKGIASVTGEDDYLYTARVTASCTVLEGYEFDSWTGDQTVGTFNMPPKAVTMKANAKPINYQIVYQNVSDEVNNPTVYNINSDSITLKTPTRDGYDFVGWTEIGSNAPASMSLTLPKGSTGEKTFRANWVDTIVFDLGNGQKLQLNKCKPNTFAMGSPLSELGRSEDEFQHNVTLTNIFYMGKFEITQAQYKAVMGINPSAAPGDDDPNRPVENVSWNEAITFCEKLNQKLRDDLPPNYVINLPTEAMWEYACRAGSSAGLNSKANINAAEGACSNLDVLGWYKSNSGNKTHPVGQKQPNAWGLYDMHGNVWEWCLDYYDADFYINVGDCTNPWNQDDWYDPPNVFRGGSFDTDPKDCRSATRIDHVRFPTSSGGGVTRSGRLLVSGPTSAQGANIGFRVCLISTAALSGSGGGAIK